MSKREKKFFWYIFFLVLLFWIVLFVFIIYDGRNKFLIVVKLYFEGVFFRLKFHDFISKENEMLLFFLGFISLIICKIFLILMENFY